MTTPELVLAQQRLAAKRDVTAKKVSSSSFSSKRSDSTHVQPNSRLPTLLDQFRGYVLSGYEQVRRRGGSQPFFRVGQFDAEQLDEELLGLLKTQATEGLKLFGSHIQHDWDAEITFGLRAILFKLTVWDHDATYGAALQNLQFSDARYKGEGFVAPSRWQKAIYGLSTLGVSYGWTKWKDWVISKNTVHESSKTIKMLSGIYRGVDMIYFTGALLSFLVFLVNGRYRTIIDRILRLRLVPLNSHVNREVSFEYLNRQLVWHAFTEFLLFLLPLLGVNRWRKWLTRAWKKTKNALNSGIEVDEKINSGELAFLPELICAICYQEQDLSRTEAEIIGSGSLGLPHSGQENITNPYECIPCGCIYCFVCIATRLDFEEGDGWTCLKCGIEVKECKPWNGDLITEPDRPILLSRFDR